MGNISDLDQYVQEHVKEAIAQNWVVAYFQPLVRSLTGELASFEALARWNDPTYGFLTPDIFIPPLEKNGDIYLLDLAILEIICRYYKEEHEKSFDFLPVSFNLSRVDLDVKDIHERINSICDKYEVPHKMIHIEITESSLSEKEEALEEHIQWFHRDGFEVWMDDFGNGFSTLNTLQTHSFDVIKLDMMFLRHFNKKAELILRYIIKMAKSLGIGTVCEGVETLEHAQYLKEIGCERLQGWYYGRPQPGEITKGLVHDEKHNYETSDEQEYWNKIAGIDLLSGSPEMIVENGLVGLYSQFELVNLITPDKDTAMQIYSNAGFTKVYGEKSLATGIKEFAESEVFIDDRKRYKKFMDFSTIENRYKEQETHFLSEPFRLKDKMGGFRWKLVTLLKMTSNKDRQYLYEIQNIDKKRHEFLNNIEFGSDQSRSSS
ncbi:MAG: EAL domain-containing protein [Treponema sp.]|nr:EAL domain-containing protein [Treponema sp.]